MWRLLMITTLAACVAGCGPLPRGGAYGAWSGSPQETIAGVPIQWRVAEPGRFHMVLGRAELYQQQDAVAVLSTRLCPRGYTIDSLANVAWLNGWKCSSRASPSLEPASTDRPTD